MKQVTCAHHVRQPYTHIQNDSTQALQIQENFCSNNQNVMSQDGKQIIEECSIQLLWPGLIVVIPAYLPPE